MKISGWELKLEKCLQEAKEGYFEWGKHDCASWTFSVISSITGTPNPSVSWQGKYWDLRSCLKFIKASGWNSLSNAVSTFRGSPLIDVRLAQRGDLVLDQSQMALGICIGVRSAFLAKEGLTFRLTSSCSYAWRT